MEKIIKWLKNNPAMQWMFAFVCGILLSAILIDIIGWTATTVVLLIINIIGVFVAGGVQFCHETERDRWR